MTVARSQRLGLLALTLALVGLALPAAASARPGWEEQPRSLHLSFQTAISNGYQLAVKTTGHRQVELGLSKGGVSATYKTSGKVSREGIEANFGTLGELAVEFSGRPTRFTGWLPRGLPSWLLPHRKCNGRRPQQETGTFHGTIRFEGENGFARIDTDRARGTVRRTYRRLCKGRSGGGIFATLLGRAAASAPAKSKPDELSVDVVLAAGSQGDRIVVFEAFGIGGSSDQPRFDEFIKSLGPFALVSTIEYRDDMRINRQALATGEEGSLIVSPPKRKHVTATVAFPKPFEGTAEFEHAPGTPPTWIGTLAARLPGAGAVPLTGDGLKTLFCRLPLSEDGDEKTDRCTKEAEEIIPAPIPPFDLLDD